LADTTTDSVQDDAGKLARYWITRLQECDRWQQNYLDRCKRIVRRYRNERPMAEQPLGNDSRRFAILWSNTETLAPAVYAHSPKPVVMRRFKDADPVGRQASEVLERALTYSMDQYEFDDHIKLARTDYLLLARGTVWVRYVPHEAVDDQRGMEAEEVEDEGPSVTNNAETPDQIPYAEVVCDHVAYDDFGMEPCRSWDETTYVWRRVFMSRKELIERFGRKIGAKVPLDWSPASSQNPDTAVTSGDGDEGSDRIKRAAVYEIWDKETAKVYWICKSYPNSPLDVKDDWLKLQGFFPCPRPLTGSLAPDSYIPIPDFVYYQDQAEELDELTARIGTLVDGLKLIGVYAGEEQATLQNLFMQPSGTLVPIQSMAQFSDKGGLKELIQWMPIEQVAATLEQCFEARKRILDDIYQITGIADILRGMSDPRSTATAEQLKGQWGSLRVRDKQKEMSRFARDVLRLQAQIIATQFGVSTLKAMTDVKMFDTAQQKQAVMQALDPQAQQMRAQQGQPPLPMPPGANPLELQQMAQRPTWEEVNGLLKNTPMRSFHIDVETDSTIEPDETEQKQSRVEFITALSQYIGAALPLLQSAPQAAPLIAQGALYLTRGFRAGREMEDTIETVFEQLLQNPPKVPGKEASGDPNAVQVATIEQQTEQIKQSGAANVEQLKIVQQQQEMPIRQAEVQLAQGDQQLRAAALQRDPNPQAVASG